MIRPLPSIEDLEKALAEVNNSKKVLEILEADRDVMVSYLKTFANADFWARNGVRIFFSDWEARLYQLRRFCVTYGEVGILEFSQDELLCLRDKRVVISDEGEIKHTNAKTGTSASFRFVFSILSRALGIQNYLNVNGDEWREFKETIHIRDRLMHPKVHEDLLLTGAEATLLSRTVLWIDGIFEQTTNDAIPAFSKLIDDAKQALED